MYACETSMELDVMQSEVVRMMGRPIIPGATQLSPPNHQVALLNWFGLMNMLAEQTSAKQDMFRKWVVSGHPSRDTPDAVAIDAHCHLSLLQKDSDQW